MKIHPSDGPFNLAKADVIKSIKTGTRNSPDSMVWYEKVLLPPHEYMLALGKIPVSKIRFPGLFRQWSPGRELRPVVHIRFFRCTPRRMPRLKGVFCPNYLPLKKGR